MKHRIVVVKKMITTDAGRNLRWLIPHRRALSAKGDKANRKAITAGQINKGGFCFFEANDADFSPSRINGFLFKYIEFG